VKRAAADRFGHDCRDANGFNSAGGNSSWPGRSIMTQRNTIKLPDARIAPRQIPSAGGAHDAPPRPGGIAPAELNPLAIAAIVTKPIRRSALHERCWPHCRDVPVRPPRHRWSIPCLGPPPSTISAALTNQRSPRILLAEDQEVNQIVASELLTQAGLAHDIVSDGQQALEAVRSGHYDLILRIARCGDGRPGGGAADSRA